MSDTPNPPSSGDTPTLGGNHAKKVGDVKSGLKVDVSQVKALHKELKDMHKTIKDITTDLGKMGAASSKASGKSAGYNPQFVNNSPPAGSSGAQAAQPAAAAGGLGSVLGGLGKGGAAIGAYYGVQALTGLASGIGGAIDGRMERGREYASGADKLNVLSQQIYGISQDQALDNRRPLTQFRIGQGGINAVTQFQMSTGANSSMMARQASGVMASSGYSIGMGDILAQQQAMMSPEIANRMFMMGGGGAVGAGGKINGPMETMQTAIKRAGLVGNPSLLKGALTPGSVTRQNMGIMGVPEEMQTQYIQYAQQQEQFTKKGGRGMYDPSKVADRKRMGIEGNLATQQQETTRVQAEREERYISRHLDSMSKGEKMQQNVITALERIDDTLAKGFDLAHRAGPLKGAVGGLLKTAGGIAMTAGMVLAMTPAAPGGAALMGLGAAGMAGGSLLGGGDPTESSGGSVATKPTTSGANSSAANDANVTIPAGYGGGKATLNDVKQRADFKKMHPKMQQRMLAMFRANPKLGIGGGWRDTKTQETMFRQRYRQTSKDTGVSWQGSNWERVSGAPAAPPGRSMHEIGLAADLIGDIPWLQANAGRFGLKTFKDVNNEPWHVQPTELPNSRRDYESAGSVWGSDGGYEEDAEFTEEPGAKGSSHAPSEEHSGYGTPASTGVNGGSFQGMSISQIIEAVSSGGMAKLGSGSMSVTRRGNTGTKGAGAAAGTPAGAIGAGVLSGTDVARVAYGAGFRGDDLINMVAIAKRESHYNSRAFNGNLSTGDKSYGLWQLNTLNSAKGGQMGQLVNSILGMPSNNTDFDALFDPATNARVAYEFYKRNNNTLRPWGAYKGEDNTYNTDVAEAKTIVAGANLGGDPTESVRRRSPASQGNSSTLMLSSTPQITISPSINFHGTPSSPDLEQIASSLVSMVREGLATVDMRSA